MKTALIISSSVAASRVGATASAFCLQRLGVNTVVLPTTLLGRHPGWGAPGGQAISAAHLRDMWDAIHEQGLKFDAVMTGYMADPSHIDLARDIIKTVKHTTPGAFVLVDPVMGDHGRLYVSETIAESLQARLIPLADIITPNVWELEYLTGQIIHTAMDALRAAKSFKRDIVATSVPQGDKIGALYVSDQQAAFVSHAKFAAIPHGGGDALAGTLLAHILGGKSPDIALAQSVSSIFDIISAAQKNDLGELPLIRHQQALTDATPLIIETLSS